MKEFISWDFLKFPTEWKVNPFLIPCPGGLHCDLHRVLHQPLLGRSSPGIWWDMAPLKNLPSPNMAGTGNAKMENIGKLGWFVQKDSNNI